MARNIQSLFKITSNVLNRSIPSNICFSGARTLFTASSLGIDGYKKTRENIQQQFTNMTDKFRDKMTLYVNEDSKNMIFTEDLKNMVHLVHDDEKDLDLLLKMMIKFAAQNEHMRFGSYVFGPVIMRTYYYLDKPDGALAVFNNPALEGFFNQVITYQILMDLLYNHGRYSDVIKVFESILPRNTDFTRYPRHAVTLVLAACYKEDTPESWEYAVNLWKDLKARGGIPKRKSSIFFAGLALNRGKPDIALEVLFGMREANYISVRNLKVAALSDLNRLDDVAQILRMSLSVDAPTQVKHTYTKDVMRKINAAIQRAELTGYETIVNLVRQIEQNNHVLDNTILEDLICSEIAIFTKPSNENRRKNLDNMSPGSNYNYQQNRPQRQFNKYQRTGLKDLI